MPLVPEDEQDVSAAKRIHFASNDPTHMRKDKRRDIKTQPLFGGKRNKVQLAKLKMDGGLFRKPPGATPPHGGGPGLMNVSSLRTKLGVETKKKT